MPGPKGAWMFAAIMLTGCATVSSHQTQCEQQHPEFPAAVRCLKTAIGQPRNEETKLYLLTAEHLSERVQRHELSDAEARLELQKTYVRVYGAGGDESFGMILLRAFGAGMQGAAQSRAESNAALQQQDTQPSSAITQCRRVGSGVQCTTFGPEGTQTTHCRMVGSSLYCY